MSSNPFEVTQEKGVFVPLDEISRMLKRSLNRKANGLDKRYYNAVADKDYEMMMMLAGAGALYREVWVEMLPIIAKRLKKKYG